MSDIARYRSKAEWETKNPILRSGEPGFEDDTGKLKVGNGTSRWNDLPFVDGVIYSLPSPAYSQSPTGPQLASVATSGSYNDLQNKPSIPNNPQAIGAQPAGNYVESTTIAHVVKLTQAAYDALSTKDPTTLYVIASS
jgi:hypothetical protein